MSSPTVSFVDTTTERQPWLATASLLRWLVPAMTTLVLLIFFLISLGGLVRNEGAGLSCPDWPLCYGKVVPPMDYQIFLEWFHRLIAGPVSTILLAVTAVVLWDKTLRNSVGKLFGLAIGLLMAQIVLGGLTVLGLLSPKWVSSHLAVGLAFFGTNLIILLRLRDMAKGRVNGTVYRSSLNFKLSALATCALYGQIILGGLVSSNYAGLACPDFPTCNGVWWPVFEGLVRFQVMHQIGAAVATLSIVTFLVFTIRKNISRRVRIATFALPALLTLQIFLGIGSVLMKLPILMSVAHLGTAAALLAMLLVTTYEIRRS